MFLLLITAPPILELYLIVFSRPVFISFNQTTCPHLAQSSGISFQPHAVSPGHASGPFPPRPPYSALRTRSHISPAHQKQHRMSWPRINVENKLIFNALVRSLKQIHYSTLSLMTCGLNYIKSRSHSSILIPSTASDSSHQMAKTVCQQEFAPTHILFPRPLIF